MIVQASGNFTGTARVTATARQFHRAAATARAARRFDAASHGELRNAQATLSAARRFSAAAHVNGNVASPDERRLLRPFVDRAMNRPFVDRVMTRPVTE